MIGNNILDNLDNRRLKLIKNLLINWQKYNYLDEFCLKIKIYKEWKLIILFIKKKDKISWYNKIICWKQKRMSFRSKNIIEDRR